MAEITGVTNKYFTIASETFEDNLSASIGALEAVVPLTNTSEYDDGDNVVLTVDPGTVNEASFVGTKSGNNIIDCEWTEGNLGVGHDAGATVVDYDSATHHNLQTKGIRSFANDDGTLKTAAVQAALGLGNENLNGWNVLPYTFNTVGHNGNRSYTCITSGQNLTTTLSPGMRIRTTRTNAGPSQSMAFAAASTQYAQKTTPTGITFNGNFTIEAMVYMNSYNNNTTTVLSRDDVGGTAGWCLDISPVGLLRVFYRGAGGTSVIASHQSIPLKRWVHIAVAVPVASPNSVGLYMDGVQILGVASSTLGTSVTQGTAPLQIGYRSSATNSQFDGNIQEVRLWSVQRTTAEIKDNAFISLTGSETNLIGLWQGNGNFNDKSANANHMTSVNGAVATSPLSGSGTQGNGTVSTTLDYGIIQKVSFTSSNTEIILQVPEGCALPTSGVSAVAYSSQRTPYNFPSDTYRWTIETSNKIEQKTSVSLNIWYGTNHRISVPAGKWTLSYQGSYHQFQTTATGTNMRWALLPVAAGVIPPASDESISWYVNSASAGDHIFSTSRIIPVDINSITTYQQTCVTTTGAGTVELRIRGDQGATLRAVNAYL